MASDERMTLKDAWRMASGLPHRGWRRVAHSVLVPVVFVVVLSAFFHAIGSGW